MTWIIACSQILLNNKQQINTTPGLGAHFCGEENMMHLNCPTVAHPTNWVYREENKHLLLLLHHNHPQWSGECHQQERGAGQVTSPLADAPTMVAIAATSVTTGQLTVNESIDWHLV